MNLEIQPWLRDDEIVEILGERVKSRRLFNNISQEDLAVEIGASLRTVQNLEAGKGVKLEIFIRILRYLQELDKLNQLLEEQSSSIKEIYQQRNKKTRKRAAKKKS